MSGERSGGVATSCLLASLAALGASGPGAIRTAAEGAAVPLAWTVLAGAAAAVIGPVVVLGRFAMPLGRRAAALAVGLGLALGPAMGLGAALKAMTHHRPLGAATFGIVACALALAFVVGAARLLPALGADGIRRRWIARGLLALVAVPSALMLFRWGATAFGADAAVAGVRAGFVDALLCLALALAAVAAPVSSALARLSKAGVPVLIGLLAASSLLLAFSPELMSSARAASPVLLGPATWLAAW